MGKMMEKGEAARQIAEKLAEGDKTKKEIVCLFGSIKKQTAYNQLNNWNTKYKDKYGAIKEVEVDDPVLGVVKKLRLEKKELIADEKYVDLIIKNLKSNKPQIVEIAVEDLRNLCRNKKIMHQNALKFILNTLKTPSYNKYRVDIPPLIRNLLLQYQRDKDEKLIMVIKGYQSYFEKVALSKSEIPKLRNRMLILIEILDDPKRFEIAFEIMKQTPEKQDPNDKIYRDLSDIYLIIRDYSLRDYINCRKKLYDLAMSEKEIVSKRAIELLNITRARDGEPTMIEETCKGASKLLSITPAG